jgi:hypothetical protein
MSDTEEHRRDDIAAVLRRVGLNDLADETLLHLPESVTLDEAGRFFQDRGLSRSRLTDLLGGSP